MSARSPEFSLSHPIRVILGRGKPPLHGQIDSSRSLLLRDCLRRLRHSAFHLCEICSRTRSPLDPRKPAQGMLHGRCADRRKHQNCHQREDARDGDAPGIPALPVFPASVRSSTRGECAQPRTLDERRRNPRLGRCSLGFGRYSSETGPIPLCSLPDGLRCSTLALRTLRLHNRSFLDSGPSLLGVRSWNCIYRNHSKHHHQHQGAPGCNSIGNHVLHLGIHSSFTQSSFRAPQRKRVDQRICGPRDVWRSLDYCGNSVEVRHERDVDRDCVPAV